MSTRTAIVVTAIVTAIIVTAIVVPLTYFLHPDYESSDSDSSEVTTELPENERFDCYPEDGVTKDSCEERGCIYDDSVGNGDTVPYCYYPPGYGAYKMSGSVEDMAWGYRVTLVRMDVPSMYGKDEQTVILDLEYQTDNRLRFKYYSQLNPRFEVPLEMPAATVKTSNPKYDVQFVAEPFSMAIVRVDTGVTLWNTSVGGFTYSDQFLSLSTRLPSNYIYGFGEHEHQSFHHDLNWLTWGMFSRDQPPAYLGNLYGVHPFYMSLEEDHNAHGVFLLNSNAMDITVQPLPALTYRTIGGVLDFWMFLGPTVGDVVSQYTEAIGRPYMPPYWSLGFQLSRYGYNSLDRVKEVVAGMRYYDIPHDVQYGDIDYMERQLDFTYDLETYDGLPEFVDALKLTGTRYITILDPAISVNETVGTYPAYDNGTAIGVFITESDGKTELLGK
uniref:Maltase n=1 Tax=Saccoglossus kowalevskii TaxID=10224 RepID=A0ABM0M7Q3_SACKO